jgi:ABC-2 type transport system permease protein
MTALVGAELRKLTTLRSAVALAAAGVLYPLLALLAAANAPEGQEQLLDGRTLPLAIRGGVDVALVAVLVLGVLAVAGELRHGTIVPTLLAAPRRASVLAAKAVAHAGAGSVVVLGSTVLSVVVGSAYLRANGVDPGLDLLAASTARMVALLAVLAAAYATIGVAVGAIVANQTAAVAGVLGWILAVENVVPIVLHDPGLRRWLPGGAASRVLDAAFGLGWQGGWTGLALLLAVAAAATVAAFAVTARRDLT